MVYLQQVIFKCDKNPFFHNLVLTKLHIKGSESIKYLSAFFLDENLTWKEHIKYTENKT